MPQIINTNIASINAQRNLDRSQSANQTALQRLSSGLRINSAKDDAAGLAISTRFSAQIRGLAVATRNAGDGIALAQTAEGALGSINDNLQRIRELAVQSANATNSDVDREALQSEVDQLVAEISRTADETDFNGRKLLDGSFNAIFQIGANAGQTVDVSIAELTANNLGAAKDAGVSAIGNSSALSNGDLIINGVAIAASKAGDDTASTSNAAASAIAKVATINSASDQTGVTAVVNTNVVSGSEMSATAGTLTLTLNGVEIALSTTASTVQTRAAVAEAINSVANQTGVRAINTNTDSAGVQLVAEDGRNIEVAFSNLAGGLVGASDATIQAATGLAIDGPTTYVGGYTLVADGDVSEILIDGGNGTGNGDLSRAGLVRGSYSPGTAATVSTSQSDSTSATGIDSTSTGTLTNKLTHYLDNATLISGGSLANTYVTTQVAASAISTNFHTVNYTINSAGGLYATSAITIASSTAIYDAASALNGIAGINAFERIEFTITDFVDTTGGETLFLASAAIALPDSSLAAFDTTTERLQALTESLNNASYRTNVTVTAELNAAGDAITVRVDNASGDVIRMGVSTGGGTFDFDASGNGVALAVVSGVGAVTSGNALLGTLAYNTSGAVVSVDLSIEEATGAVAASGELYATKTYNETNYGTSVLGSTGTNEVNATLDGAALTAQSVIAGSTVNDLVNAVNAYTNINAFENISLTVTGHNMQVGDTFFFGTLDHLSSAPALTTSGVGVSINDANADGTISLAEIADAINGTSFLAQELDVSAELDASGNLQLEIRNYAGNQVLMEVDGEGRSLHLDNGLIGSVTKTLSGELRYASETGGVAELTIADAAVGGEFYANNSSDTSFSGVNGLAEGDITLNGVVIGAAKTEADTASAEEASDSTRILSSSKELSGIAIAAAINEVSGETGVRATVNATEVVGGDGELVAGLTSGGSTAFEVGDSASIYINGVNAGTVTLQANGSGLIDSDRAKADALDIINSVSGRTGVVASDNGVSLTLTAADGRNISIAVDDQTGADESIGVLFGLDADVDGIGESTFGSAQMSTSTAAGAPSVLVSAESLTYETTYSTVTLESAGEFNISAGSPGADELNALGFNEGDYGGAVSGTFLTDIDISSFEGAQAAITSIDNAIGQVASQRAVLGAIQNRLESTVSNLQITKENLQAANSRIEDADFAAETAELSRSQVLQQAGISVLAQANAQPQQVLSLLQ